jgi:hypothetical protein
MRKRLLAALMLTTALISATFAGTAPDTLWSSQTTSGIAVQRTALNSSGELIIAGVTTTAPYNIACFKQATDKSYTWTTNRFDLNGRGATLATLKVTGVAVSSTRITLTGYFAATVGSDTMFVLQIDASTGTQTALLVESVKSRSSDIVKSGLGYVILGTSTPASSSVITTWTVDSAATTINASRITGLTGYLPGTINVTSGGANVFSCATSSGALFLEAYSGTTNQAELTISGSVDTTYMASTQVLLRNDTAAVAYTEKGTNGVKVAFCDSKMSSSTGVKSITSVISSAQLRGAAQDAYGYILSGTISSKIWLARVTPAGVVYWQYAATTAGRLTIDKCLSIRANGESVYGVVNGTSYYIQNTDREGIATFTPSSVTFNSERGTTLPASQNVVVGNSNSATLGALTAAISYSSGSGWLQVGVSGTGNAQTIVNSILTNNLTPGSYSASVVVTGNYLRKATAASYSVTLVVTDTTKPAVMVTSPSSLTSGASYTIRWTATDASGIASRTVEFYNGLTTSWTTCGTSSVDSLRWTLPTTTVPIDSCRFRVTVVDASTNANMAVGLSSGFRLDTAASTAPVVAISMPASINMGSTYQITWSESATSSPIVSRVLLISKNNGTTYDTLAKPTTNSYLWSVPDTAYRQCRVRITVTAANSRTGTATSGTFIINDQSAPSVAVTAPNGGEKWRVSTVHSIKWTASDNVGVTRTIVAYSTNGTTWNQLNDETGTSSGVYVWTLPSDSAATAWVKVTVYDAAGNTNNDVSDASFKILSLTDGICSHIYNKVTDYFGVSTMGKTVRCGVNAGAYSVKVYDVAGRLMMSRSGVAASGMYQNIPVTSSGASIVRLEQAGKMLTKKIMLQ